MPSEKDDVKTFNCQVCEFNEDDGPDIFFAVQRNFGGTAVSQNDDGTLARAVYRKSGMAALH